MIKTTTMLVEEYKEYSSPLNKIRRMADKGELFPIIRGLYETDRSVSGYLLAGAIYGPSYLSFEFALSKHGLIPEAVYTFTSATFEKKKKKTHSTMFGTFTYRDIPSEAFPLDVMLVTESDYPYKIASAEKALCDTLYAAPPLENQKELRHYIFNGLRIDEQDFDLLDKDKICKLADGYHCTNLKLMKQILRK